MRSKKWKFASARSIEHHENDFPFAMQTIRRVSVIKVDDISKPKALIDELHRRMSQSVSTKDFK